MNKNIEEILKEALENHDAGYVSGAWEAMSARLDGTAPTPFYKKWWVAAAFGTVLVGTAAFFMLNETQAADKKAQQMVSVNTDNPSSPSIVQTNKNTSGNGNISTAQQANDASENPFINSKPSSPNSGSGNSGACGGLSNKNVGTIQPKDHTPVLITDNVEKSPTRPEQSDYAKILLPAGICANEELTINNPNASKFITVTDNTGKSIELAPGKKITLTPKSQGTITVQSGDRVDLVAVHDNKTNLYIDVDPSLLYENGIPTLKFKVAGNSNNLVWESNVKGNETKGDTYIVHPYTETSVEITVSNTNEAGCKVEEKQVVTLDERYNLLAPTAFDPTSNDPRNKTFMPYALTERSAAFEMLIIDPRTGAKVFSTTDSAEGWTGVDQRTGEMVKSSSVWAWKVMIKNPNTGEPREYSGTITKL